jgi:hypothetical protein
MDRLSTGEIMTDEPRDHVLRARLPWRSEEMTECGRPANDVASVITLEELQHRVKSLGRQRTAFTVCMTCWTTTGHASRWETSPIGVIGREAERCGLNFVIDRSSRPEAIRFTSELRAIEALIAAHRDEFDQYLTALADAPNLADQRRKRDRR